MSETLYDRLRSEKQRQVTMNEYYGDFQVQEHLQVDIRQLDAMEFAMETDLHIDKFWREGGKLKTGDDLSLSMIIKKLSLERSRLNKDTTQNNIDRQNQKTPPLLPTYLGSTVFDECPAIIRFVCVTTTECLTHDYLFYMMEEWH